MKKLFLYVCAVALAFQSHAQKPQDSTFVMTVGLGDMAKVKTLLEKGADPNAMTGGATALRWAGLYRSYRNSYSFKSSRCEGINS